LKLNDEIRFLSILQYKKYVYRENTRNRRGWLFLRIDIFYYTLTLRASVLFGLFVIPCHIRSLTVPETLASETRVAP